MSPLIAVTLNDIHLFAVIIRTSYNTCSTTQAKQDKLLLWCCVTPFEEGSFQALLKAKHNLNSTWKDRQRNRVGAREHKGCLSNGQSENDCMEMDHGRGLETHRFVPPASQGFTP